MFHFVATMSFQEFHFPFHNDRRSWRQHFLSMNRGGKADWYNVDLPFLLQGLGPSFCCIHQYWPLKILLVFVFQYGDFGGGVQPDHKHMWKFWPFSPWIMILWCTKHIPFHCEETEKCIFHAHFMITNLLPFFKIWYIKTIVANLFLFSCHFCQIDKKHPWKLLWQIYSFLLELLSNQ